VLVVAIEADDLVLLDGVDITLSDHFVLTLQGQKFGWVIDLVRRAGTMAALETCFNVSVFFKGNL